MVSLYELNNIVVCKEEDVEIIKGLVSQCSSELENIQYSGNQLTGDIRVDNNGFMILTLPYDEGWKILVNGSEVYKYEVNGGFIGIPIGQGKNHIEMYFMPKGFKLGVMLSAFGCVAAVILFSLSIKKRKKSEI